jgi:hypothetical protein
MLRRSSGGLTPSAVTSNLTLMLVQPGLMGPGPASSRQAGLRATWREHSVGPGHSPNWIVPRQDGEETDSWWDVVPRALIHWVAAHLFGLMSERRSSALEESSVTN